MKTVRAKFRCTSVQDFGWNKTANFSAVAANQGENADFAKATPSGQLSINIDGDVPASQFFEPKKEYYLTFEAAE
jgi:hypothetical protein